MANATPTHALEDKRGAVIADAACDADRGAHGLAARVRRAGDEDFPRQRLPGMQRRESRTVRAEARRDACGVPTPATEAEPIFCYEDQRSELESVGAVEGKRLHTQPKVRRARRPWRLILALYGSREGKERERHRREYRPHDDLAPA